METLHINQLQLMTAICKEICDQQAQDVPASNELMNTCIEAANMVKEKLDGLSYTPVNNA